MLFEIGLVDSIIFEPRVAGAGPSPPLEVTIVNEGEADMIFLGGMIEIDGLDAEDFALAGEPDTQLLAPGQSRVVGVRFEPDSALAKRAILTITTDAGKAEIDLMGRGVR